MRLGAAWRGLACGWFGRWVGVLDSFREEVGFRDGELIREREVLDRDPASAASGDRVVTSGGDDGGRDG